MLDHVYPRAPFCPNHSCHHCCTAYLLVSDLLLLCLHCLDGLPGRAFQPHARIWEQRSQLSWGLSGTPKSLPTAPQHTWMGCLSFWVLFFPISWHTCLYLPQVLLSGKTKLRKCQMENLYLSKTPQGGFCLFVFVLKTFYES